MSTTGSFCSLPALRSHRVGSRRLEYSWQITPRFQRGKKAIGARMGVVDQFGNECWSERSQIYFINDKRLSRTRRARRVALLYQPTSDPTFVATYRQILFPEGTWD